MTYRTVMVHLVPGASNTAVLRVAAELATRFDAGVIGIAACQPMQIVDGGGCYVPGELVAEDRARIEDDLEEAEVDFRTALEPHATFVEWRSTIVESSLAAFIEAEARSADLLVTGMRENGSGRYSRTPSIADIIMQAGRPVFVAPSGAVGLQLDRVVIGWTDTAEARRAIAIALPILHHASSVRIVEIAGEEDTGGAWKRIRDVSQWLARHGVASQNEVIATGANGVAQLSAEAGRRDADLIVAGAYGHSRVREWALGGVTDDLLRHSSRCLLLSH